jgi:hypothetical protein
LPSPPDTTRWVGVWITEIGVQCHACGTTEELRFRYERFPARHYVVASAVDAFRAVHRDMLGCWGITLLIYERTGVAVPVEPFSPIY